MASAILLFGRLKDAFGGSAIPFPDAQPVPATAAELRRRLIDLYPDQAGLLGSRAVRIAVNQEIAADEAATALAASDEIALLPPLSGG